MEFRNKSFRFLPVLLQTQFIRRMNRTIPAVILDMMAGLVSELKVFPLCCTNAFFILAGCHSGVSVKTDN